MPDVDERHTLLFSATFPDKVQKLAKQFLREGYLFIKIGIVGGAILGVFLVEIAFAVLFWGGMLLLLLLGFIISLFSGGR